jgi:hypothetical protein
VETRTIVSYGIVIAAFAFSGAFWAVDIQMSDFKARRQLQTDLVNALQSLPDVRFERGRDSGIGIEDLEKTGQLSEAAKTWLKGARITARPVEENTLRAHPEILGPPTGGLLGPPTGRVSNDPRVAVVRFPNGQQEYVLF